MNKFNLILLAGVVGVAIFAAANIPPSMAEARAAIAPYESSRPASYLCEDKAREGFARALGAYSRAQQASGIAWPDLAGNAPSHSRLEIAAAASIYARFVDKSVLPISGLTVEMSPAMTDMNEAILPQNGPFTVDSTILQDARAEACAEFVDFALTFSEAHLIKAYIRRKNGEDKPGAPEFQSTPEGRDAYRRNREAHARIAPTKTRLLAKIDALRAARAKS